MPYHTPSVGWADWSAILVDIFVDIYYDQWWQLGARALLKISNLEIIRLLFYFELWPDWKVPQEYLVARFLSELDGFLAELGIERKGKSHAEKAEIIQTELTDQSVRSILDVDSQLIAILQEPNYNAAAELFVYLMSPQLAGIHFRHWIRILSQDIVPEVDNWLDTISQYVRSLCTFLRNELSLRIKLERITEIRSPLST